jgi:hypothetical protein
MTGKIPAMQCAVELAGPDKLCVNSHKKVYQPGPFGILAEVEAVGLCFSDLKLLKQFDSHARKSEIISGISKEVLGGISSYKPGRQPTVPGHEACCVIAAVGEKVRHHYVGQRVLVQADYRWLKTANSNAAFGYNFEGALQQYVLMDERVITEPQGGESLLVPVDAELSASAVALVEPWACVESSYITQERNRLYNQNRRRLSLRRLPVRIPLSCFFSFLRHLRIYTAQQYQSTAAGESHKELKAKKVPQHFNKNLLKVLVFYSYHQPKNFLLSNFISGKKTGDFTFSENKYISCQINKLRQFA